jgi:hypothetical protein
MRAYCPRSESPAYTTCPPLHSVHHLPPTRSTSVVTTALRPYRLVSKTRFSLKTKICPEIVYSQPCVRDCITPLVSVLCADVPDFLP